MSIVLQNMTRQFLFDIPTCNTDTLISKVLRNIHLFRTTPRMRTLAYHHIPATGNTTYVPPHRIPGHYKQVDQKIYSKEVW